MDFMGIGPLELIVILVIGLLVLGPNRMVDTARSLGRMWREVQRGLRDVTRSVNVELEEDSRDSKAPQRGEVSADSKESDQESPGKSA